MLKGISDSLFVSSCNSSPWVDHIIWDQNAAFMFSFIKNLQIPMDDGCSGSCELMNELFGAKQGCKER